MPKRLTLLRESSKLMAKTRPKTVTPPICTRTNRLLPGKSPYRRCEAILHLYEYRVNQELGRRKHNFRPPDMVCPKLVRFLLQDRGRDHIIHLELGAREQRACFV